ncbi:DUF4249 domain-containing protein [Flavilitoribacter nigricans]|nr:DUF4249 domain-containing protein [Flavilitoribacter nigricans]
MKWLSISITTLLLGALCWSCNLEKEIEIDLPDYDSKTVVECYLEPGRPFQLLLTRSTSYFSPFDTATSDLLQNLLVNGAKVSINHAGVRYDLNNQLVIDQQAQKLYNYYNENLVPQDYTEDFELAIELQDGSTITGTTRLLPVVPIDSVVVEFEENDTLARVLTYFTDIPDQTNYYRRMLHHNSLDSLAMQDFTLDDRVVEDVIVFGTGYEFAVGDTVFNTLFHIDRTYFDFLESVDNAVLSNGNPFGQPSPINSKLEGTARSVGIFTGLSYTREITVLE